jgi:phenol 2-monooxygenase
MNVGTHDATNLGWKLAAFHKGWINSEALDTYHIERHQWAERQSRFDRDLTELIAMRIPERFNAPPGADPMDYHWQHSVENAAYTVGLGISYQENLINQPTKTTSIPTGARAPDVMLYKPGNRFSHRLQELTPNNGKFWILVFAGGYESPFRQEFLQQFREYTDSDDCFIRKLVPMFQFLTIVGGSGSSAPEVLGCPAWGRIAWDHTGDAHRKYGIRSESGGVVVVRPDGILSYGTHLTQGAKLFDYFSTFVRSAKSTAEESGIEVADDTKIMSALGEVSIEGQKESQQKFAVFSTT